MGKTQRMKKLKTIEAPKINVFDKIQSLIIYILVGGLASAILYQFITNYWTFKYNKDSLDFPYVFDGKFRSALNTYRTKTEYRQYFLVHGPRKVGKTRGILQYAKHQAYNGRLIIVLDFSHIKNFTTNADIVALIANAIISGCASINDESINKEQLLEELKAIHAPSSSQTVKDVFGSTYDLKSIKDPLIKRSAATLIKSIDGNPKAKKHPAISFLSSLDKLYDTLFPMIALIQPNILLEHKGENDLSVNEMPVLVELFNAYQKESHKVGIIFEISNQTALYPYLNNNSFERFYLGSVPLADIQEQIVWQRNLLTLGQTEELYGIYKGYLEPFEDIARMMEHGILYTDAEAIVHKRAYEKIYRIAFMGSKESSANRRTFLFALAGKDQNVTSAEPFPELIDEGIICYKDAATVSFSNAVYRQTVTEFENKRWAKK